MPRPLPAPTTFDGWLGAVIDGAANRHGGRPVLANITKNSSKTIDRRIRGEASFLVSEITIIARYLDTTAQKLVDDALERYGAGDIGIGYAKLLSEGSSTKDDYKMKQAEASEMTAEEIEDRNRYELAATDDAEQRRDESGDDPDAPPAS